LEKAGYQVDVFTTKDITVDFFKNLPQMNYEFVVIRTHGVADFGNENSITITRRSSSFSICSAKVSIKKKLKNSFFYYFLILYKSNT